MKAITLIRPWPIAMFFLKPEYLKDIENRSWKPPNSIIGQRIAIHAGNKYHPDVFAQWLDIIQPTPQEAFDLLLYWQDLSDIKGIIGTVVVDGWYYCRYSSEAKSPWAEEGMICWRLKDPVALAKPIPCRGAQGLWEVPAEIVDQIKGHR